MKVGYFLSCEEYAPEDLVAQAAAAEKAGFEASNLAKLDIYFQQWLFGTVKPTMNPTTFFQSTSVPNSHCWK